MTTRDELIDAGINPDAPIVCVASRYTNQEQTRSEQIGTFTVPFDSLAALDTISWRGWYCSLFRLAKIGGNYYPDANLLGFAAGQVASGIRRGTPGFSLTEVQS